MTRKDCKLITKVINKTEYNGVEQEIVKDRLVENFMWALKEDNPKFDEQKFKEACYERFN